MNWAAARAAPCSGCCVRRSSAEPSGSIGPRPCSLRHRAAIGGRIEAGRLELVRGDFASLPFADKIVDAILAVNVVYFMKSSAAVREARRVLRPGGRIVLYATDRVGDATLAIRRAAHASSVR